MEAIACRECVKSDAGASGLAESSIAVVRDAAAEHAAAEPRPAAPMRDVAAEYLYLSAYAVAGDVRETRSKTRMLDQRVVASGRLQPWIADGRSSGQRTGMDPEIILQPAFMCRDPFRGEPAVIVLCEALKLDGTVLASNTRHEASRILGVKPAPSPEGAASGSGAHSSAGVGAQWTFSQQVVLYAADKRTPLGWPPGGGVPERGRIDCAVGASPDARLARRLLDLFLRGCRFAGLHVTGVALGPRPAMVEYTLGPVEGIRAGDELWVSRYILCRLCELLRVHPSFDPVDAAMPEWTAAGCSIGLSTRKMRGEGAAGAADDPAAADEAVAVAVDRLRRHHFAHLAVYGPGNEERLAVKPTSGGDAGVGGSIDFFTAAPGRRDVSVLLPPPASGGPSSSWWSRVLPREHRAIVDLRPAANVDPYPAIAKIYRTVVLNR